MASGTSQYITAEGTKQCNRCQEWFPVDGFPANRQLSTGLSSWCRVCHREAVRRSRAKAAAA